MRFAEKHRPTSLPSVALLATAICMSAHRSSAADDLPVIAAKPSPMIEPTDSKYFDAQVRPILAAKCVKCHGGDTHKAELNLTTIEGIQKGSESGAIVDPGKPDKSRLYEVVHHGEMPPDGQDPLTSDQVETIRRWIESGAKSGWALPERWTYTSGGCAERSRSTLPIPS